MKGISRNGLKKKGGSLEIDEKFKQKLPGSVGLRLRDGIIILKKMNGQKRDFLEWTQKKKKINRIFGSGRKHKSKNYQAMWDND